MNERDVKLGEKYLLHGKHECVVDERSGNWFANGKQNGEQQFRARFPDGSVVMCRAKDLQPVK